MLLLMVIVRSCLADWKYLLDVLASGYICLGGG
jgi:hypothetical protein